MKDDKLKKLEDTLRDQLIEVTADVDSDKELNYQQKVFVIKYCQHYNGTQAAREAGYSEISAHNKSSELLKLPEVQVAILKRQQAIQLASAVTKEYVLSELAEIVEEARAEKRPNRNLQMKALDMIAKVAGFYSNDNPTVNIQNNIDSIKIEIVKSKPDGN